MRKVLNSYLTFLLAFTSFSIVEFALLDTAAAGVLFRNRQQVIRAAVPAFRQQNYRVDRSTVALRRTSTSVSARPIGTVQNQMKLISTYNKYEQNLYKWEKKKSAAAKKRNDRRKAMEERQAKRQAREAQRIQRQQERAAKVQTASNTPSTTQQAAPAISTNPTSRGALGPTSGTSSPQVAPTGKKREKGFWSSLFASLFSKGLF